jgi:methylmalonyl-CoA/ethylmalonyl-CoA epimerase
MRDESPVVTGLAQVAISVSDLEASVAFYRDVLGLTYLFSAPPSLAFLQCGPTRLMLSGEPPGEAPSRPTLYYAVADIHAAVDAVRAGGAAVTQEPAVIARLGTMDVWLAFTQDPDGNPVGLMAEVPVQA